MPNTGHQQRHDQHQPPVQPGHHRHHPDERDDAVEHHEQHLHVQRLHRLGVVGDAADELAGDGAVEEAHRQAQHVAVDRFANALHRTHRQPRQPNQLAVAQPAGQAAGDQRAAEQAGDGRDVRIAGQQVAVDEGLAQQRAQRLQCRGKHQPDQRAFQQRDLGQRGAQQQLQRGLAFALRRARVLFRRCPACMRRRCCGRVAAVV
jgi:hypothetical protein